MIGICELFFFSFFFFSFFFVVNLSELLYEYSIEFFDFRFLSDRKFLRIGLRLAVEKKRKGVELNLIKIL